MEADQRTTEMEKRLMDVVAPLVADREPAVLRKPGQCALHHPPVPTQLAAALYALSCYAALYPALSQGSFAFSIVVGFVGMQLLGTLPRPSPTGTLDWLYGVDELLEDHRVVDVCCAEHYRQRDAPSVRNKVALGALLSFIRRIRCGFWAPLLAGMEAESSEARSHSIWSASPRRSRRTRCSLSHPPASCHSRKRRQQVMPDPHAISWGSISQGIPLFSTKTIPVRAARSSMRGLPPWGFGGSGGRSGSMVSHNSSVTSSLAMFSCYPLNGFVRLIKAVPTLEGWQISPYYRPAREVGGDFYDFHLLSEGRLGLVVGDVTGKGVPAALVMSTTCGMLQALSQTLDASSPEEVLARVNEMLFARIPSNMFVTCFYTILDPESGRLLYANAGHNLPYCSRRQDEHAPATSDLSATGMPLGLMTGMSYEENETVLFPGEGVLFYTDGLVEAHNPQGEMFGIPRLRDLLSERSIGGTDLSATLMEELERFTGEGWEQEDDITLLTLQRSAIRNRTSKVTGDGSLA